MNPEIIAPLVNAIVASTAYVKQSVDGTGATAGFLMGTLIYLAGGPWFWGLLMLFFISASVVSKLTEAGGAAKGDASGGERLSVGRVLKQVRGNRRDHVQVFANGAPALILALIYASAPRVELGVLFAVALASANADTWAGELGALSRQAPVLITSGDPVQTGRSGAVTLLGLSAAAMGAIVIAVGYGVGHALLYGVEPAALALAALVGFGGFVGAVLDSFFGATIQAQYQDDDVGDFHDAPPNGDTQCKPDRGFRVVTNDMVNLLSGVAAVLVAVIGLMLLS